MVQFVKKLTANLQAFSYCICRNAKMVARPLRKSKAAARRGTACTNILLKLSKVKVAKQHLRVGLDHFGPGVCVMG
jgi:hypothetical protein